MATLCSSGPFLMSCEGPEESLQECACSSGACVLPVFIQSVKENSFSSILVHQIADVKQFGSCLNVAAPVLRLPVSISRPTLSWQGCCSSRGGDSRDAGRSVWPSNTHLEALYCCYLAPFAVSRLHFHSNLVQVETLSPFYSVYSQRKAVPTSCLADVVIPPVLLRSAPIYRRLWKSIFPSRAIPMPSRK